MEFYEILVYGYFAVIISKVFFPAADEAVSLLVTFGTFGASFLARPVGAIFLGAYGDRVGRKRALTLSILLMTIGTGLMTAMPSYASIGIVAPVLVIGARLLQGFSVGGEFGSSTAFLVEHRPDRAGFFASWQWASQGLAAVVATSLGVLLTTTMSAPDLQAFGWRIPFAVGLLIGPVGYYIRSNLEETPEFLESGAGATARSFGRSVGPALAHCRRGRGIDELAIRAGLHADLRHPRAAPAAVDRVHRGHACRGVANGGCAHCRHLGGSDRTD